LPQQLPHNLATIIYVIFIAFLFSFANSEKLFAKSLEKALQGAIDNSPKIRGSLAKLNGTREGLNQIYSSYLPTVKMDFSRGRERDDSKSTDDPLEAEITDPRTAAISMSLNLFRGGKTSIEIDETNNRIGADAALLKSDIQSVILEAAIAYSQHYKNKKTSVLNENNKAVLKALLDVAKARSKYGEVSETDVFQARSRYAGAVADEIKSQGDFFISKTKFESIFGIKADGLVEPSPLKIQYIDVEALLNATTPNNLKLINLRKLKKAADNNVQKLKRDLWPTVDFTSDYTKGIEVANQFSVSNSAKFKVSLSVPLYSGGIKYSKIRQARHIAEKAGDDYDQALKDTKLEVLQAWFNYKTAQSQITALEEAVSSSKIALNSIKKEADVGSRAFVEVLDAEQQLLESNASLLDAKNQLVSTTYQINQLTGRLIPGAMEFSK
jgi:outer membrane protein